MADTIAKVPHRTPTTTPRNSNTAEQKLRHYANVLSTHLCELQSLTTAIKLASQADDGGGEAVLYWPDLMQILLDKIPSHEVVQSCLDEIAAEIGPANSEGPKAPPATRNREALVRKAKVAS